ncbi:MAG: fibronectin type III domain-containing protein [Flavobacteriales bacterium]|nr:fibronectin type III domain-containing protein [Flavobacteriales bacterium]
MKKFTLLMSFILLLSWQGMTQTTLYLTTSGGSYPTEKWVNITDGPNGTGTVLWAQGDGNYGNGQGLVTDSAFTIVDGTTYYINCYDRYDDGWDGTTYQIRTAPAGGGILVVNNGGVSPDDGNDDDASGSWEVMDDERESSEAFSYMPAACMQPSNLSATLVTSNSASLGWIENGSATSWNVEWGTSGFTQGTGTMVSGTTNNPEPITGLSPSTAYEFYVQADCGGAGTSSWVGPFAFTSAGTCGVFTVDLEDSYGDGWNGGYIDIYINGVLYAGNITLAGGYGPETVQVPVNNDDIVSIDYTAGSFSYENEYRVYNQSAVLVATEGASEVTPNDIGDYTIPTGLTACPACPDPSLLTATAVTATSASLGWFENGSATSWNVEWGTSGFTQGTGNMVSGTTNNPEPITGLSPSTAYEFYVQADCGGSGTSAWVGPFAFTTLCSAPVISSFPWTENFDGVTTPAMPCGWIVDNVNADTYTWITGTTASSAPNSMQVRWNSSEAANDWSFTPELVLVGGQTYQLSFNFAVAGTTFPEKLKVMYGSAQNVAGMTDLLFDSTLTNTVFDTAFATFTPATSGSYFIGFHNYSDANMFRIYVDDVTVEEVMTDTCSIPSNLSASNITPSSALLNWIENGNATEWDIEWGLQGFTLGTGNAEHVVSKPHLLNNVLTPNTAYEFYVRADCGNGDTSLWVGPYLFVTPPCMPIGLELGNDTTLCSNQSLTLNAPAGGPYGYSWSTSESTSSITVDTASLGGNGTYNITVSVIDFSTMCIYNDAINVTFSICTGIKENSSIGFAVYPNPTNGMLTIRADEKGTVEITNLQGKVVYKNTLNSTSQVINLSENAKGVYFVSITTSKGVEVQKIVIQ